MLRARWGVQGQSYAVDPIEFLKLFCVLFILFNNLQVQCMLDYIWQFYSILYKAQQGN